ncbi:MAG TPA: class I SAM-dependent methyltransferase [Polyangiaceae bacterium]|nr:class I SAM-dependent methyltransferase [Polyangiaceae bacterium]
MSQFDAHAHSYDSDLSRGLSLSGESRDFFLEGRVSWLKNRLDRLGVRPTRVLDYGCGTGSSAPVLRRVLGARVVVGVDPSEEEIAIARRDHPDETFALTKEFTPASDYDLVYCNGVFHHVAVTERSPLVKRIRDSLRPGALFALWENNPWNPGTRWVMSRIPFDRDAVMLSGPETCRLLRDGGFEIVHHDFLFIFPKMLRALRGIEPYLAGLPLGAQYIVLGRKPAFDLG